MYFEGNDLEAIDKARMNAINTKKLMRLPTVKSEETMRLQAEVKERFQKVI
jgi:hypothetical protein